MPYWIITLKNTDTNRKCYISLEAYRKAERKYLWDRVKEYPRSWAWWRTFLRHLVTADSSMGSGPYDGTWMWHFHKVYTTSEMIDIIKEYPSDNYAKAEKELRKRCKSRLRLSWRVWRRIGKYLTYPVIRVKIERVWIVCR